MISLISFTADGPEKLGIQGPPLDKIAGSQHPYLDGPLAGNYKVPSGYKMVGKTLSFNVRTGPTEGNYLPVTDAGLIVSAGVSRIDIGASQLTEFRHQWTGMPIVSGADEMVTQYYNAFQRPSWGEGITCPNGTNLQVRVTPTIGPKVWKASVFGREGTTTVFKTAIVLTSLTTANQTLISYTPGTDFVIMGITIEVDVVGPYAGQIRADFNGSQIIETPPIGLEQTASNCFDDRGYCGYGMGMMTIPLWGITFYENEKIEFFPCPWSDGGNVWGMTITGVESSLGGGGGTYPIENDVRNNVNYGPTGAEYNGDLISPAITDVRLGTGYGADGTEYTGTMTEGVKSFAY